MNGQNDVEACPPTNRQDCAHSSNRDQITKIKASSSASSKTKDPQWNLLTRWLTCTRLGANVVWFFYVFLWHMFLIDWQRVAHLFRVDVLNKDFKISEAALANELSLLQTTAAFLFGAGLIGNFMSGAPWSPDHIQHMQYWGPTTNPTLMGQLADATLNATELSTPNATADKTDKPIKLLDASLHFRGLWGACMLLTFASVVIAHVARSTLFVCWSLARNGIDGYEQGAKEHLANKQKTQHENGVKAGHEGHSSSKTTERHAAAVKTSGDTAAPTAGQTLPREAAEELYKGQYNNGRLRNLLCLMAVPVSITRFFFNTSLLLWLATIMFAIIDVFVIKPVMKCHSGVGVLVFTGLSSLVASVAYMLLVSKMWQMHTVFRPSDERRHWVQAARKAAVTSGANGTGPGMTAQVPADAETSRPQQPTTPAGLPGTISTGQPDPQRKKDVWKVMDELEKALRP